MRPPESNWDAWLRKADNDLLCVRNNLSSDEVPWDAVCFHAQQAAEKALKAVLVRNLVRPPRTHDLISLLEACLPLSPALGGLRDACERINAYSTFVRYPGLTPDPTESQAREAALLSERVVLAVRTSLS